MCSSLFGVKRIGAMDVNARVHLQSTVILRMASLQSTPFFFTLPLIFFWTVFSNEVIHTNYRFYFSERQIWFR